MAKLARQPDDATIRAGVGVIDFYPDKGQWIARRWPRKPRYQRSELEQGTSAKFGLIGRMTGGLSSYVRQGYVDLNPTLGNTWVDLFRAQAWGSDERIVFVGPPGEVTVLGLDILYNGGALVTDVSTLDVLGPELLAVDAGGGNVQLSTVPYTCRVTKSGTQSTGSGVLTAVTWDVETFDLGGFHESASNTARFTAPVAGWYVVQACAEWAANATGQRDIFLRKNGTTDFARDKRQASAAGAAAASVNGLVQLDVNDIVEVYVLQNSGVNLNIANNSWVSFAISRIPGVS